MDDTLSDTRKKALKLLVKAAVGSAECQDGWLVGGAPGNRWEVISLKERENALPLEAEIESWIRGTVRQGDFTIFDGGPPPELFYHLGFSTGDVMFGVGVFGKNRILIGVLLIKTPFQKNKLIEAQSFALKTHAIIIADILQANDWTTEDHPDSSIERLRLLESAVVNAKDGILITEAAPIDQAGPKIVYCNPAFFANTGYSAAELVGLTPRILQCEETSRETLDLIRSALINWRPIEVELINARRDGSRFWVQLSIVPVANERGWFTHWVSVQRDISERKEAEFLAKQAHIDREERITLETRLLERERIEKALLYATLHDDLTSLHNRSYIMSKLSEIFNVHPSSHVAAATVLFLDLDRFKFVNDSLGHRAGDVLLIAVARRLEACIRESDIFARVGGDEFAIFITGENQSAVAVELAQQIVNLLSTPFIVNGQAIFTTCSLGIVTADSSHTSPEDLLRDADVAMYTAKKQGRGRWSVFDATMRKAAIDALLMQNAIKQALINREFRVDYQPIYNAASGEISGVEALARWSHPELGQVPPDIFISVAENIGMINELGGWIMLQACQDFKYWKDTFPELKLHLNVNVSGKELNTNGYIAQVERTLELTGIEPYELQIEITESVFLHEPETTAKTLETLRTSGIRVALDDFGTGYSSLIYIDRYTIDAIKIDRSFVSRMMSHSRSEAIVRSILSLGKTLSLAITAEGVETNAQLQVLKAMKCPFIQGYLLCMPINAQEITKLLQSSR
ncbi:EAL domain-containing protein [Pseudomonas sp. K2I15]|uniref:sensor domain-containing protein n=1 Tax=Pseudomonas sp. K2I15 TaxID=2013577 RepID=UPI000B4D4292|nr:EAL domain-containing protein [Pseudomonas sp. K2I15]OWP72111.1 diguanylate phosphodiesterase [Pseudomonas sp. K2I15]